MTAAATFCATLVDEWVRRGVRHAVVAPGSRSTPMALALAARHELALHLVHDERSAAFVALGIGLDGTPAVLLCTSGTAAANFHPAVVEAGLSEVPMLVLTADRPPELRDVGAAQTIDQQRLFGGSVRWFHDPGVPDDAVAHTWRSLASRAVTAASSGPVHLNLPFREPLVGDPGPLPPPLVEGDERSVTTQVAGPATEPVTGGVLAGLRRQRGIILAGGRSGVTGAQVQELSDRTGWPVLADPISEMRSLPGAVSFADAVLRHAGFADAHVPEVIVRVGRPAASKVLAQWAAAAVRSHGAVMVQVGGPGVIDPDHTVAARLGIDRLLELARSGALGDATATPWASRWRHADERARVAIDEVLHGADALTEPAVARAVARVAALPTVTAEVVVSSSMPVRDLEWYGGPEARAHANRGANGIDGVTSTAIGRALAGHRTILLTGDVAFLHDSAALTALADREVDLRIVVVDNDGGGIFSFLPQADALPGDRFERLFGTPHGTDVVGLAASHRLPARTVSSVEDLTDELRRSGPRVVHVRTDRRVNVAVHAELHAAVAAVLDRRP